MVVSFKNVHTKEGQSDLNDHFVDNTYIDGWTPSNADVKIFDLIDVEPSKEEFPQLNRWYKHIDYLVEKKYTFREDGKVDVVVEEVKEEEEGDSDDDVDLFGDDSDDEEAEAERSRLYQESLAKKKEKGQVFKTQLFIDVKPWGLDTPMDELEAAVRSIEMDGLVWGSSKFVEVAFGVKKLHITAVVEDEKVYTDDLEEKIVDFDDFVQSMDIVGMQKL